MTDISSSVSLVRRNPMVALLAVLLSLLDRLAGWWLNWRMTRAIAGQPDLARFDLHHVEASAGKWEIEAFAPFVPVLAEQCARLMTELGAQNYVEFELLPRLDRGLRPIVMTIRYSNGEMPSVKAARFEAELQRINTTLAHCGTVGIAGEFHDAADAITQMADHIQELERAWNQLGEPEDYADHADNVFEVTP
jgi:hypothetical protein